jgi:outer membrane protein assembly factor BamD
MLKTSKLTLIIASFLLLSACSKYQKLLKKGTFDEKYKTAVEYYKKGDYYRASTLFEDVKPNLVGSDQQEQTELYFAYCKYHQGLYTESNHFFKKFAETFARSEHVEEATYMAAYSLYKDSPNAQLDQASTVSAIAAIQDFINGYPNSKYVAECDRLLKDLRRKLETKAFEKTKLYYTTKDYDASRLKSAVIAINNFQKDYPDSEYNEELAYLKVEAGYEYAQKSLPAKQTERYNDVIAAYQIFVDKYPNSKHIKQAEKYFENCNKDLVTVAQTLKEEKELREQYNKEQKERLAAKQKSSKVTTTN